MTRDRGRTAVYRLYDADDTLLYVGSSAAPHRRYSHHSLVQPWWPQVTRKEETWYPTRAEAQAAEAAAVSDGRPLHNVRLRSSDLTVTVTFKVTPQEAADLDRARGRHSRAEWLRRILLDASPRVSAKYAVATLPSAQGMH